MKPPLIEQLDLSMCDKSSAVRLACRIALGIELQHLKQALGYEIGAYWSHRDKFKPGERLRWAEYCLAVAGISERSATLYFQCAQAVMTRLRCLKRAGWKDLHRKMEKQPSTMTAAEREDMIQKIINLGLTKGETQEQLLREFRGVHLPALETDTPKLGEPANERGFSLKELYERYPDEDDAKEYALAKLCGSDEENARLLVVVMREMRRRKGLAVKKLG